MEQEKMPTQSDIKLITEQLEDMLSAHEWKIKISLYDPPMRSKQQIDNGPWIECIDYFDEVSVKDKNDELICKIPACFVGFNFFPDIKNLRTIWGIAWGIQNHVCNKINKLPSSTINRNEAYWKLWEKLPKKK